MKKLFQQNELTGREEKVKLPKGTKKKIEDWCLLFNKKAPKHIIYHAR